MRESVAIVIVLYKAEMSVYHERLLGNEKVTLVVVDNTPDRDLTLKGSVGICSFTEKYGHSYRTE